MKIQITESQLLKISLNEAPEKYKTLYEDDAIKVITEFEGVHVPFGETKDVTVWIYNKSLKLLVFWVDTNISRTDWGYRGEGPITHTQFPVAKGKYAFISFKLTARSASSGGFHRSPFDIIYNPMDGKSVVRVNISLGWDNKGYNDSLKACKLIYSDEAINNAKSYWLKWLSNDTIVEKYKKIWGYSWEKTESIFKDYIKAVNRVYMDYVIQPNNNTLAYVQSNFLSRFYNSTAFMPIYVNCAENKLNYTNTVEKATQNLIHEIQHLLNTIHPWRPGNVTKKTITKKMSLMVMNLVKIMKMKKTTDEQEIIERMVNDGYDVKVAKSTTINYIDNVVKGTIKSYVEDPDEIASRIFDLRRVLKLEPNQDIIKNKFIQNIDTTPGWYLTFDYIMSDLSLDEFLNQINTY